MISDIWRMPYDSPVADFPSSARISDDVCRCGPGLYLITPNRKNVRFVGWAQNDYWAMRAWELPFLGELAEKPPIETPVPSLAFAGRPETLNFGEVTAFEQVQPGWSTISVTARYRMSDGRFLYTEVDGSEGVRYYFERTKPKASDPPTAIALRLPGTSVT